MRIIARLMLASWRMVVALFLGLIGYGIAVIQYPAIMNKMVGAASNVMGWIGNSGIDDRYMVWVNILNMDDKMVFMSFIIIARILWLCVEGIIYHLPAFVYRKASNES
jgi:uncharacterized protein YjeT (DUF2065 family)